MCVIDIRCAERKKCLGLIRGLNEMFAFVQSREHDYC
jgi:hypothetical protein